MKKHGFSLTQNKILRWLLSAAILFYVLVPNVGICHCSECHCCNHSDSTVVTEQSASTSCCSAGVPVRSETNGNDSESCPCLLTQTPDTPIFVTSPQVSLPNVFTDGLKLDAPISASLLPVTVERLVSFYHPFENPTSRLPVRIHLLLLVLLN